MKKAMEPPQFLPPPAGYSSWLAYAVATMDVRSIQYDHDWGGQPQWPGRVTRAQIRAAARAELGQLEGMWREMERARGARIDTPEIPENPEPMKATQRDKPAKTTSGKIRNIRLPKK